MPYCSRCGVELDNSTEHCPLCRTPIQKFDGDGQLLPEKSYPVDNVGIKADKYIREHKGLLEKILTASFLIPVLTLFAINFFIDKTFSWSLYPVFSLILLWSYVFYSISFYKRPYLISFLNYISTLLYLYLLDSLTPGKSWFPLLGFPLTSGVFISSFFVVMLSKKAQMNGLNIAAYILLGLTAVSINTDIFICIFLDSFRYYGWSLIPAITLIPVSLLLFIIRYNSHLNAYLKRFFHI
jgi:hypothetical protein